jgi:hypothetical protein
MNNPVSTIEEYLAQFNDDEVAVINQLRDRVKELLPKGYVEEMHYNMITYVVPLSYYPKGYHVTKGMPLTLFRNCETETFLCALSYGLLCKTRDV